MEHQVVWLPDPEEGYVLGTIEDIHQDFVTATTIRPPGRTIQASFKQTFVAEKDTNKDVNDNCALMFLNEANLLNNLKVRYDRDKIYVSVLNLSLLVECSNYGIFLPC